MFLTALVAGELFLRARATAGEGLPRSETVHHVLGSPEAEEAFGGLLPLQGPAHESQVLCTEETGPVFVHSDQYGFNNPTDARFTDFEVVVTGDSFVHGWCVPPGEHMAAVLGPRVLNLGVTGSGPLAQLGALLETGVLARPGAGRTIFWTVLLNDVLYDLERELGDPRLRGYFRGEIQGLAARSEELTRGWRAFRARATAAPATGLLLPDELLRIYQGFFRGPPTRASDREYELRSADLKTYLKIVARARARAEERGYRFRVVFIPEASLFFDQRRAEQARLLVAGLGPEVIDLTPVLAAAAGRPQDYYAAMPGYYGHFNGAGFALMAGALRADLASVQSIDETVARHSGGAGIRSLKEE